VTDSSLPQVTIYTDGGCDPNPGPGGWGAILVCGIKTKELSGAEPATTNNRMELTAAIEALRALRQPCRVTLYTDSQYLKRGITEWLPQWQAKGWRRSRGQPVENADLWQELLRQAQVHQIEWQWLRGHLGHPLNERADRLAHEARRRLLAGEIQPTSRLKARPDPPVDPMEGPQVALYARGCVIGSGSGPGGYAAVLVEDGAQQEISGSWPLTTSNVMELWAVIAGLRALRRVSQVTVYTTSKYVLDGATRWLASWERNHWHTPEGKPVKNPEIWAELSRVLGDHNVEWRWLSSQDRDPHSQRAAVLARQEASRAANKPS